MPKRSIKTWEYASQPRDLVLHSIHIQEEWITITPLYTNYMATFIIMLARLVFGDW